MAESTEVEYMEEQTSNTINEQGDPSNVNPFVQENLEKSIQQFEVIQSAAREQIQSEVNKVKDYIRNFRETISDNLKNIKGNAVPGTTNSPTPFDLLRKATENTSAGIAQSLNTSEASIQGAMDSVNKSAMFSEDAERGVTQSMMSVDDAMADQPQEDSLGASPELTPHGVDQTPGANGQPEPSAIAETPESPDMNQMPEMPEHDEQVVDSEEPLQPQTEYEEDPIKKEAEVFAAMEEVLKAQRESEDKLKD